VVTRSAAPEILVKDDAHFFTGDRTSAHATSLTLLDRVKRQEPQGWQRFCALYTPLVRWWCTRRGVAGSDVEDVVQEVFLTVLNRIADFQRGEHRGGFRAWLRQITAYKMLEHWRRRGEVLAEGGSDAQARLAQLAEAAPEDEETERALVVRVAMDQIRGRVANHTWEAATRTLLGGEPTDVVAAALGMKPGAVHVAKTRFLQKLREELGELLD
jgi:RNA polymerase sigma-70 factor, ECF subfamily